MSESGEVTRLLETIRSGDRRQLDRLFDVVYGELRRLARSNRRRWQGNRTLNTTALIHEVYLKLASPGRLDWQSRAHFFGTAARAMRQVLINYAERARAAKRGSGEEPLALEEEDAPFSGSVEDALALHEALGKLEQLSERQCRVVECRFFAGMDVEETAEALDVSAVTVKRDWRAASAWLHRELSAPLLPPGP